MNAPGANHSSRLTVGIVTFVVGLILAAAAIWKFAPRVDDNTAKNGDTAPQSDVASPEVVADFYTSLAALDVEENQRAATLLQKAVEAAPHEPSLWSNLTVARLRLRDLDLASQSLEQAVTLAGDTPQVKILRAVALEQAGEIEAAIDQLREVREQQPHNLAASYSLATLLSQLRTTEADEERLALMSKILDDAPDNLRARCEQARLAAALQNEAKLQEAIAALSREGNTWPEAAAKYLQQAQEASGAGDFRAAGVALAFFENLLMRSDEYQQSLVQLNVSSTTIGAPWRKMLRLKLPPVTAAPADLALTFELAPTSQTAARPDLVLAFPQEGERRSTLMSLSGSVLLAGESAALPFPGSSNEAVRASVLLADLNADFTQDLVLAGPEGCRVLLRQEDGTFAPHETSLEAFGRPWRSAWATDVESDGDLDLLLSDGQSPLQWIRNNGDMTFAAVDDFLSGANNIVQLLAVDLDEDGDVDLATLNASGEAAVWRNERGGKFAAKAVPLDEACNAIACGDVDRDGGFDLAVLTASGEVHRLTHTSEGQWSNAALASWPQFETLTNNDAATQAELAIADMDNNGAVDIVASAAQQTVIWLGSEQGKFESLENSPALRLTSIVDMNDDGLLDLIGMTEEGGAVALNQSKAGYAWQVISPQANPNADNRINSFGLGGRIEVRAGTLVQTAAIQSPQVHFGLGLRKAADIARIIWPNGTVQVEFDLLTRQFLVTKQRLKGSCPWVFAYDGSEFHFVKDFIWRSPLGLRINAQETAGVAQTEDWIKIAGDQLTAANGRYQLRITAELWETHFFDHVALLAVDHPANVEIYVDERFTPAQDQDRRVYAVEPPQPVSGAVDECGRPCDEALHSVDGTYVDSFTLGDYQGVAAEHWVEFELPANLDEQREVLLIGNGWIYPTDSSLNVAIAQQQDLRPYGLILEQRDESGNWLMLRDDLGFPAGKNKDAVIALSQEALAGSRHFRLRTNMEIYWDYLGWTYAASEFEPELARAPLAVANLRQRGYSKLLPIDRRRPDTPLYEVEAAGQRWLDLEGFYTRFGDVRELLVAVDDRYVIMNAGDEMVFEFEQVNSAPPGWRRDFILVGDGWVKDGDFNTVHSQWVRPLPRHGDPNYDTPLTALERDPVYLQYADDWQTYHTRYVAPREFQRGLWPAAQGANEEGEQP